jgi:hypothetical protein
MVTKRTSKKSKTSAAKKSTKKTINKVDTTGPLTPAACMDKCFDNFSKCVRVNPKGINSCIAALRICLRKCIPVVKQ